MLRTCSGKLKLISLASLANSFLFFSFFLSACGALFFSFLSFLPAALFFLSFCLRRYFFLFFSSFFSFFFWRAGRRNIEKFPLKAVMRWSAAERNNGTMQRNNGTHQLRTAAGVENKKGR